MSSTKSSSRPRKKHHKDDAKQDNVAQVHQSTKKEERAVEQNEDSSTESNRTFVLEDKNDKYNLKAPSRDISVDTDVQINTKIEKGIIGLIESEIIKEKSRHSHFTDSRPQSLSFYEEDNPPEELTGNLQPLSPEERKHYRKRKEQFDQEDNDGSNNYHESSHRDKDQRESSSGKKSKSRRKKHSEPELGMGDSRETILPKEKRKSKKSKKREYSPNSNSSKKTSKRKSDKNDVIVTLEDLKDDVFEREPGVGDDYADDLRMKSPRRNNEHVNKTHYVQKRNRFELDPNELSDDYMDMCSYKSYREYSDPLHIAIRFQELWYKFSNFTYGLLGGLALAHILVLCTNNQTIKEFIYNYYSDYSECYVVIFTLLNIFCLVAVLDRFDVAHLNFKYVRDLIKYKKGCVSVILYTVLLLIHFSTSARYDSAVIRANDIVNKRLQNYTIDDIQSEAFTEWYKWSIWRGITGVLAWLIISLFAYDEDYLCLHLKSMLKYIPNRA